MLSPVIKGETKPTWVRFEYAVRSKVDLLEDEIDSNKNTEEISWKAEELFGEGGKYKDDRCIFNKAFPFLYRLIKNHPNLMVDTNRMSYTPIFTHDELVDGNLVVYFNDEPREFTMALSFMMASSEVRVHCDNLEGTLPKNKITVDIDSVIDSEMGFWIDFMDSKG